VVGLAAVAVDKQESGHVRVPFLPEACQRPAPCGPPFTLMTNESGTRGQEAASFSTATEDLHMRTACGAARWASARGLLEEESADPAQVLPGRPAQGAPLRTQPGSSVEGVHEDLGVKIEVLVGRVPEQQGDLRQRLACGQVRGDLLRDVEDRIAGGVMGDR